MRQTLEEAPAWAPAWKLLGDALGLSGAREEARVAYERAAALDPEGASARGSSSRASARSARRKRCKQGYVAALFDEYADRFDAHLIERLAYRAPQAVLGALREVCAAKARPLRFRTRSTWAAAPGSWAKRSGPSPATLAGVDLSSGMLAKARAKLIYDELAQGELQAFLRARPRAGADLVLAADVLVYVADLQPIFGAAHAALGLSGLFGFTVQSCGDEAAPEGYRLGLDHRFAHAQSYLRASALSQGFTVAHLSPAVTRQDEGRDVEGFVVVLASGP